MRLGTLVHPPHHEGHRASEGGWNILHTWWSAAIWDRRH